MSDILLVSDLATGGAAVACGRAYEGMRRAAAYRVMWLAADGADGSGTVSANAWPSLRCLVAERMVRRFSRLRRIASAVRLAANEECVLRAIRGQPELRLVNIHNIHERMSFSLLEKLPKHTPLVWTLHDMWPLTGFCSYSYGCEKYLDGCRGDCPEQSRAVVDQEREWQRRHSFYCRNKERLAFVAPSEWLTKCARRRLGDDIRVECIPYSLDLEVFRPVLDRMTCRRVLGLPDMPIVLAGAQLPGEKRKGMAMLIDSVARLRQRVGNSFGVVLFGNYREDRKLPPDWILLGTVKDEALLNLYYNSADVFVMPSMADNFPNTLLEATAAGTPSVTFDVGGCPEIIRDNLNGFVTGCGDVEGLVSGMERILTADPGSAAELRANCRRIAEEEYALGIQAGRYQELFSELMERGS